MDYESWPELGATDPELQKLLDEDGPLPTAPTDAVELRKLVAEGARWLAEACDRGGTEETTFSVAARDGHPVPVRVRTPTDPPGDGSPLMVFLHGGGFATGTLDSETRFACGFVRAHGVVVVSVDYRLAPEHPFPIGLLDSWDVVQWAAREAQTLKVNLSRGFLVGGVSAGAGMASAIVRLARDLSLSPPITGCILVVPPTMGRETAVPSEYRHMVTSYEQNADAVLLSAESVKRYMDWYCPDDASPLFNNFAPGVSLADLPPTYLQVCGQDPLRDEALIYEYKLRVENGLLTRMDIYAGLPHGFWIAFRKHSKCAKLFEDSVAGVGWLLEQIR